MLFIKILRYIYGTVVFAAYGGFTERFINLCREDGLKIRNIQISGEILKGEIKANEYKKIRRIAKNSGVRIRCLKKTGIRFWFDKNKKRLGLFVGGLTAVFFLLFTSSYIWNVEVTGGEKIYYQEVLDACTELGLYEGVLKSKIDSNELSRLLMIKLSGKVSWASVNIKGTKAFIEIRDYVPWRKDKTYKEPCNIVADFDGLLLDIEVYSGVKAAKEGNGVMKGDLLISGIAENRDTSSQFLEARGQITALHSSSYVTALNKKRNIKKYVMTDKVKEINVFGIRIPLSFFTENDLIYDEFNKTEYLSYGNNKLPLSLNEITRAYYKVTYDEQENTVYNCIDTHINGMYDKYKNTLVLKSDYTIEDNDEIIKISTVSECVGFMGEKQIIYIE